MKRAQALEYLDAAKALLDEAKDLRVPKAFRERTNLFLEELRKALTQPPVTDPTWRIGSVVNPKTEREVVLELRKGGLLQKADRERLGIERCDAWSEVRAASRSEALKRIADGEGQRMTSPSKKRRIRKATA